MIPKIPTAALAALLILVGLLPPSSLARSRAPSKTPSDAVLLSRVKTLTLRGHGALTTHRRVPAVPQASCVSDPSLCRLADRHVDAVRCANVGSSYGGPDDVEWACTALLPEELRLGTTDVVCEGYSSPDDPYVLRGSCGVRYTVALTDKGERRYPDLARALERPSYYSAEFWLPYLFTVIFLSVLAWIVYSAWSSFDQNQNRPNRRGPRGGGFWPPGGGGGGGGNGGGGGGWDPRFGGYPDEPPPPYPGHKTSNNTWFTGPSSRLQDSWRPGFWSGLAAGGAAGYAAGSRNARGGDRDRDQGYRRDSGSSMWTTRRRNGESSSSSTSASRRYEGTGFGSTSRR